MKTIKKPCENSLKIKKSQFICRIFPANSKSEAKDIINKISQEYIDATHNCTAYIVSDGEGYDDNGEPSGTAGKPMINALRKNEITNVCVVVTRYFGGIKLGAGGLVRTYSKSVLECLNLCEIIEISLFHLFKLSFDYSQIKFIDSQLRLYNINIKSKDYQSKVIYLLYVKTKEDIDLFKDKVSKFTDFKYIGKEFLEE